LYPFPNNRAGYGVPSSNKILSLLNGDPVESKKAIHAKKSHTITDSFIIPKGARRRAKVYHKNDQMVVKTQSVKFKRNLKVKRPDDVSQSTVIFGKTAYEIVWN
jgi:hypothetical protein